MSDSYLSLPGGREGGYEAFFLGGGVIYNVIYRNFDFAVGGGVWTLLIPSLDPGMYKDIAQK